MHTPKISSSAELSISTRDAWIIKVCTSLRVAYDKTPSYIYIVELDLPGGPPKSSSKMGVEDPRQPGDEQTDYGIHIILRPNPHRQELLEQALALGCGWAEEEQEMAK